MTTTYHHVSDSIDMDELTTTEDNRSTLCGWELEALGRGEL